MQYDEEYYTTRVSFIKQEMSRIFGDTIVLENEKLNFKQRGYFKIFYKYLREEYTIIIENEYRSLNFYINDKDGARTTLYNIQKYDSSIDSLQNISIMVNLLSNTLEKNNFTLYFSKDGKYYKKTPQGIFRVKNMIEELYGK